MNTMTAGSVRNYAGAAARRLTLDPLTGQVVVNSTGDDENGTIDWQQANADLDHQTKALAATTGISYAAALGRVLAHPDNRALTAIANHRVGHGEKMTVRNHAAPVNDPAARNLASAKIHNLAVSILREHPELSYRDAVREVIGNPVAAPLVRSWVGQSE